VAPPLVPPLGTSTRAPHRGARSFYLAVEQPTKAGWLMSNLVARCLDPHCGWVYRWKDNRSTRGEIETIFTAAQLHTGETWHDLQIVSEGET
jgi:hypothetical protein